MCVLLLRSKSSAAFAIDGMGVSQLLSNNAQAALAGVLDAF